jgi:hypothetical protein
MDSILHTGKQRYKMVYFVQPVSNKEEWLVSEPSHLIKSVTELLRKCADKKKKRKHSRDEFK